MMKSSPLRQSISLSLLLPLCLVSLLDRYVSASTQPTCYWGYLNSIESAPNDGPCAVVNDTSAPVSCCSSGDTCVGNNICFGLGGSHANGSGYYLSGCTDNTLSDSSCTSHCVSNGYPDIVYNATSGLWACCTVIDSKVNCSLPTNETFSAPAPSQLTGTFTAHSSTATSYTTTTTTAISTTFTPSSSTTTMTTPTAAAAESQTSAPSPSTAPSSTDALSTGAKAAIAIGVGVAFLASLGLLISYFRARRKARLLANGLALQNAQSGFTKDFGGFVYGYGGESGSTIYSQVPMHEAPDASWHQKPAPVELHATIHPVELGGWEYYGSYRPPKREKKHDTYYHP